MSRRFRAAYGASPLHLLAVIASFAIAGYAFLRIADNPSALATFVWFAGAILAHDLLAFPLYSGLALLAARTTSGSAGDETERAVPVLNHIRIPAFFALLSLLMFFPLVLGLDSRNYERDTGLGTGVFLDRWLGLCAALFLGSALLYALRLRAARRGAAIESAPADDGKEES
jgi:hypothetical protein